MILLKINLLLGFKTIRRTFVKIKYYWFSWI